MKLVLLHGPIASGKLTIARILSARSGFALFHNHLVVDAVAALFPFGSEPFRRLREHMWLTLLTEAARANRDTIFTFAPEPTVDPGFIPRLIEAVSADGGEVVVVELTIHPDEQERRLTAFDRAAFDKLRDVELLRTLRPDMERCTSVMPPPSLRLDTAQVMPEEAATTILPLLS